MPWTEASPSHPGILAIAAQPFTGPHQNITPMAMNHIAFKRTASRGTPLWEATHHSLAQLAFFYILCAPKDDPFVNPLHREKER